MKNLHIVIMAFHGFKHYFVPPADIAPDLRISALGVRELMRPGIVHNPNGSADHMLMFFYDSAQIEDHGHKEFHAPESFKVWGPGQKQWYGNPDQSWTHSWIHCEGAFIGRILKAEKIPLNRTLRLPDPALAEKALLEIHGELTGFAHPHPVIIKHLLQNWICRMARTLAHRDRIDNVPAKLLETKQFIEMHFTEELRLRDLASRACLSVPHFCSEYKRHFKMSAIHYAIQLRLHWAAHKLHDQNSTISEIADQAGFNDLFYFSRMFKKYFGVSPRTMRRQRLSTTHAGKRRRP
ncbi:MAG: AraC family transcriptional regulator [Kiritimatiellaeota bacterium]|nr:AraC family transcriptional regulator [Kiritimatiellota bacterium]